MRLPAGERSILAGFRSSQDAEAAAQALRAAGFGEAQVDRVSRFGNPSYNRELNNPIAGQAGTLTGLTLYGGNDDRGGGNVGPLLAADVAVSGLAGEPDAMRHFLLTAVVPAEKTEAAVAIIRSRGGTV